MNLYTLYLTFQIFNFEREKLSFLSLALATSSKEHLRSCGKAEHLSMATFKFLLFSYFKMYRSMKLIILEAATEKCFAK